LEFAGLSAPSPMPLATRPVKKLAQPRNLPKITPKFRQQLESVMNSNLKYAFNLPWRGVVACAVCYIGLALFMAHLARKFVGAFFVCLAALGFMFACLACIMIMRRLIFPRVLELSEDAVLFPRGFLRTRIVRFRYEDMVRMTECNIAGQSGLSMFTGMGRFEIGSSRFTNIAHYQAVRNFIFAKASVPTPPSDEQGVSASKKWRKFPDPILRWMEPEDWSRYRTHIAASKPLFLRVAKALWFCARCLGIIILPWLSLLLCGVPTSPPADHLPLVLAVTFFFTLLYWFRAAYPVHTTEISFRANGISQYFGKQTMDHNYGQFTGWTVVERQFEGRTLLILLLRLRNWDRAFALPDANIRDQVARILHNKNLPQIPDLKPSWESE
jgi:hypothetical protein